MYYHFSMSYVNLDFGLLPLGNDQDIIIFSRYISKAKEIRVYIKHGSIHLHAYFRSQTKVLVEEIEEESTL